MKIKRRYRKVKKQYPKIILTMTLILAILLIPFNIPATGVSAGASVGAGDQSYYIHSASDWDTFAGNVSNGTDDYEGKTVFLDEDIEVSAMAGTHINVSNFDYSGNAFKGTFNGQGHTLTVNISGSRCAAPFPNADGAVFKNLRVKGSVTGSSAHASGLVGSAKGTVIFQNIVT